MKKIFVLVHDYWHHADTIEPMMKLIFDDDCDVTFTTNPADYMNAEPDLFVSFKDPIAGITHPLLEGVGEFEFPGNDEHYEMNFLNGGKTVKDAELSGTTLIAETKSFHGSQPALWYHDYGKGKVCCITPAHTTENLTYAPFVRLVKNAVKWCFK